VFFATGDILADTHDKCIGLFHSYTVHELGLEPHNSNITLNCGKHRMY